MRSGPFKKSFARPGEGGERLRGSDAKKNQGYHQPTKTAFLLIIFENRKRWNRGIVNGMQHFLGIGRTGRVFHLFHLFHPRQWNSWKGRNSWNSGERFE